LETLEVTTHENQMSIQSLRGPKVENFWRFKRDSVKNYTWNTKQGMQCFTWRTSV